MLSSVSLWDGRKAKVVGSVSTASYQRFSTLIKTVSLMILMILEFDFDELILHLLLT
jgi:hypothetical protein